MRKNFFTESFKFSKEMNRILDERVLESVFDGKDFLTRIQLVEALTPYGLSRVEQSKAMGRERLPGVPADYVIDTFVTYMFLFSSGITERVYRLNRELLE